MTISPSQIVPYFVMEIIAVPAMSGLLMACIFAGALRLITFYSVLLYSVNYCKTKVVKLFLTSHCYKYSTKYNSQDWPVWLPYMLYSWQGFMTINDLLSLC